MGCSNGQCSLDDMEDDYKGADFDQQEVAAARDAVKPQAIEIPFQEGFIDFGNQQ